MPVHGLNKPEKQVGIDEFFGNVVVGLPGMLVHHLAALRPPGRQLVLEAP
jgi:hypothetical protein